MNKYILTITCFFFSQFMWAQCTTQNITGNFIPPNGTILGGTYNVSGYFYLPAGDTIWVQDYDINSCGTLEIYADSINMAGVIMANGAGMSGGTGGLGGICVDSAYFQDCSFASQCLGITGIGGGNGGTDGLSPSTGGGKQLLMRLQELEEKINVILPVIE